MIFLAFQALANMIKELALNVPGSNNGTINFKPVAGMPDSGIPTLNKVLQLGITYLFLVAILATLVFIIWGGFQWMSSGGDPKTIDGARKKITFAVIGLIITFMAFFVLNIIGGIFGISLIRVR